MGSARPRQGAGVCQCCVDPRENGMAAQHGLETLNGFYTPRIEGNFIRKSDSHVSTVGQMLAELGRSPVFILQGHRDCAAVKVLAAAGAKDEKDRTLTEQDFYHSFGDALGIVRKYAGALSEDQQIRILEKACVLQTVNNLFDYEGLQEMRREGGFPLAYAYYSLSLPQGQRPLAPGKLGLMVFDTTQQVFCASPHEDNEGIRAADLIETQTFLPRTEDRFQIARPVDIAAAVRNEIRYALAGETPCLEEAALPFTRAALFATYASKS